ncbi:hypothetical protein NADFUDRAFT_46758 [Nadsonia fulvescens var. elongata DSM 6958]|uniref:Uncharacterized protein n=1 Tax=Nadsonia fulvescens var. elongata DSM 6958 TaxID=857566 RepID=A0A1E3PHQ4_9ASCO|nr:hypothetical protein NADFUDRAFT_46758 [Nadsonia fulvescens var. elongata DSM 6958]
MCSQLTLETLPDDILYMICQHQPQLRFVSHRLRSMVNRVYRRYVFEDFGELGISYAHRLVSDTEGRYRQLLHHCGGFFAAAPSTSMPEILDNNWVFMYTFLSYDYGFFTADNIMVEPETPVETCSLHDREKLLKGSWKVITDGLSSQTALYASNIHWLQLYYHTKLATGRYAFVVKFDCLDNLLTLSSMQFTAHALHESGRVSQSTSGFPTNAFLYYTPSTSLKSTEVCIGYVTVSQERDSSILDNDGKLPAWIGTSVHIHDFSTVIKRGILFEYIKFIPLDKPHSLRTSSQFADLQQDSDGWWVLPSNRHSPINYYRRCAYEFLNEVKKSLETGSSV